MSLEQEFELIRRVPIFSTTDHNLFPEGDQETYRRVSGACSIRTYGGDGYAYGLLASGWTAWSWRANGLSPA